MNFGRSDLLGLTVGCGVARSRSQVRITVRLSTYRFTRVVPTTKIPQIEFRAARNDRPFNQSPHALRTVSRFVRQTRRFAGCGC